MTGNNASTASNRSGNTFTENEILAFMAAKLGLSMEFDKRFWTVTDGTYTRWIDHDPVDDWELFREGLKAFELDNEGLGNLSIHGIGCVRIIKPDIVEVTRGCQIDGIPRAFWLANMRLEDYKSKQ